MNVYEKLMQVQSKLKAPKNQYNKFGNYNYRSCEDILEGLKPILSENKAIVMLNDTIELIGDRYYIKATATFIDIEKGEKIEVNALAREDESLKGMTASQITGSVSSYARKYALNGLFCIDDTKDSDATNTHDKGDKKEENPKPKFTPNVTKVSLDHEPETIHCSKCGTDVNEAVKTYSMSKFNKVLCRECQKQEGK